MCFDFDECVVVVECEKFFVCFVDVFVGEDSLVCDVLVVVCGVVKFVICVDYVVLGLVVSFVFVGGIVVYNYIEIWCELVFDLVNCVVDVVELFVLFFVVVD